MKYKSKILKIPEGIEIIGEGAFIANESIEYLEIPESVKVIKDGAFGYCSNLKKVIIKGTLDYIGESAFYGCTSLKDFDVEKYNQNLYIGINTLKHTGYVDYYAELAGEC